MKLLNIALIFSCLFTQLTGQAVEGKLLGTWSNPSLVASSAHDNTYNEVWGLFVNDHEIAVLGSTLGTHFIDVTDPQNPTELFVVEGGSIGAGIIHRDFHDFKGYLYSIADEGSNTGLQIIDISKLPDSLEVVYDSREYFSRSHNIFIDSSKARLYSLISNGTALDFAPMRIFDISNPIDPQPIGTYSAFDGYQISQVHDAFVRNDTAYLNLGPRGFAIVEFADVDTPNVINILKTTDYPQSGYNHSGWLTEDGNYYYMADETYESDIKVLDLTNLPDISIPTTFNAESNDLSITHNQIVHNGKLYVSYYFDGLQVYDISDPANPIRELYYDTSTEFPGPGRYRGAWGVYPFLPSGNILVSDMQNGLFVISGKISTSINETDQVLGYEINVAPNPSNGQFDVDLSIFDNQMVSISIFDFQGKLITHKKTNNTNLLLDLSGHQGLFSLLIESGSKRAVKRILIQ